METTETPIKKRKSSVVMADGSGRVHNKKAIYFVAIAKLLLDALLIFFFHDKLKEWNVYGDLFLKYVDFTVLSVKLVHIKLTMREFEIFFAVVFSILYLLMMTQIQVRNKGTYLLFSVLYIFDGIFLMQPTKDLILFGLLVLLLFVLRQKTLWRYPIAGLALFAYAWYFNRYLLVLIPIFLIAFVWRKSDRWGLRLLMLCLIGICFAYQFSKLAFLPYVRPESYSPTSIRDFFPEENIVPHVSYYLMNVGLIFLKLLFPFDVFKLGSMHTWIFPILQLIAVFVFLRAFSYQIDSDWKHGIRHRDVMTQDVMVFLFGFVLLQAVYEPDYGQAMRHMMPLIPFYCYLLFESDHRPYKMAAERDFTGTCPIIICHKGNEDYVYDTLSQAGKVCGGENVILLGDESNRGFCSNHYNMDDYCGEEVEHFRTIYKHLSETKSYEFELRCFERHFALYDFCAKHNIRECFFCDSDVLVFEDLTKLDMIDTDFACCSAALDVALGEVASPHILYWKIDWLRQFLDFVNRTYTTETAWLEQVSKLENDSSDNPKGDITDMTLLTAWRKITSQYASTFHYRNLAEACDGVAFDYSLTTPDNATPDEYLFNKGLNIKRVVFEKNIPYLFPAPKDTAADTLTESNETPQETSTEGTEASTTDTTEISTPTGTTESQTKVRAAILHCHSKREAYSVLLCKGVNLKLRYFIRRLVNGIL